MKKLEYKLCPDCNRTLPREDFDVYVSKLGNYQYPKQKCRACLKPKTYFTKGMTHAEYSRYYRSTPKGKENDIKQRAKISEKRRIMREKLKEYKKQLLSEL